MVALAKLRVRNHWLALFELTNHNTRMCNMILELVNIGQLKNASQGFRTLAKLRAKDFELYQVRKNAPPCLAKKLQK